MNTTQIYPWYLPSKRTGIEFEVIVKTADGQTYMAWLLKGWQGWPTLEHLIVSSVSTTLEQALSIRKGWVNVLSGMPGDEMPNQLTTAKFIPAETFKENWDHRFEMEHSINAGKWVIIFTFLMAFGFFLINPGQPAILALAMRGCYIAAIVAAGAIFINANKARAWVMEILGVFGGFIALLMLLYIN